MASCTTCGTLVEHLGMQQIVIREQSTGGYDLLAANKFYFHNWYTTVTLVLSDHLSIILYISRRFAEK